MKNIFIAVALAVIAYFLALLAFTPLHSTLIAIIVLLVALWTNEGLPLGIVSMLPIVLFPAFKILGTNATAANYSKSVIFLFLGGFMLAIATQKTHLHRWIATKLLGFFPNTPRGIIFSLAFTSAMLSSLMSNTTTALLLIPIALFLTEDMKFKVRLVLAVAYGASIGGIITPIGTPPNLIMLGFLDQHNMSSIPFVSWILFSAPLALIMLFIIPFILGFGLKGVTFNTHQELVGGLNKKQKRLLWILGSLVILLFANSKIEPFYSGLGLNEKVILLAYGVLMFAPKIGFLKWEDAKNIPFEIIFLFGAGFSIAAAFQSTGLANQIASYLLQISSLPVLGLILCIAIMVTFTTEVTSNTALTSIALPIIYSLSLHTTVNPLLLLFVATICASYAFMLPIATPPNAIAMSSGAIRVSDMVKFGFALNVIGVIAIALIAMFYWLPYLKVL